MTFLECDSQTKCEPCVSLNYCMFIVLLSGNGKCVEKTHNIQDEIYMKTVGTGVFKKGECNNSQNNLIAEPDWPESLQQGIRNQKLKGYTTTIPPPKNASINPPAVYLGMSVLDLDLTLYDFMPFFYVDAQLHVKWTDKRLAWSSQESFTVTNTNNTTALVPPITPKPYMVVYYTKDEIWAPQVDVENHTIANVTACEPKVAVYRVDHLGSVQWIYPVYIILQSEECKVNMFRWPLETYTCRIPLKVNTPNGELDLQLWENSPGANSPTFAFDEYYDPDANWYLMKAASKAFLQIASCKYCSQGESKTEKEVVFSFVVRKAISIKHMYLGVVPAIVVLILTTVLCFQPHASFRKIFIGAIDVAFIIFYLVYFAVTLPPYGKRYPLLIRFLVVHLALAVLPLISAVFLYLYVKHKASFKPLPSISFLFSNRIVKKFLCLGEHVPLVGEGIHEHDFELENPVSVPVSRENTAEGSRNAPVIVIPVIQERSIRSAGNTNSTGMEPRSSNLAEWDIIATGIDRRAIPIISFVYTLYSCFRMSFSWS